MRALNSAERLQRLQNETLEAVASGEPLRTIMDDLCRKVESIAPGIVCSIVTVDDEGLLRPLAAPSLPDSYAMALAGIPIGPRVGSCGTAIFRGAPVTVTDIVSDPLWRDYGELVLPLGLAACWSNPIRAQDGRVVGSFAIYYRERRGPSELEHQAVATSLHLCAIAIEHDEVRIRNHRLAYFDTMTGLPNRTQFNDAITRATAETAPRFGLMLIDIDNLKVVNDTMGHAVGDALIETVGKRLSQASYNGMTYRLSGDEFAVLLPDCRHPAKLRAVASSILGAMTAPLDHDGHSLIPSVTIGSALAGIDGNDSVTLRQNADFALYHAKETRRGGYVRFRNGLRSAMTRRIRTVRAVADALASERIVPYYQPIIRIDTNEIVGLEALARMRHEDGSMIVAGDFHEAMLDPKVAYKITGQMLAAVAKDMAKWRKAGLNFQHVSFNVTAADFQRGDLVQRIIRRFERAEVPLEHLAIEVTEQVFMGGRRDGVARTMETLRERGILVALDDFGTGFASLTHLLDFPVDIIKVDRSFVGGLESGARSSVIVEALIGIASRLGMKLIAEGIETEGQARLLHAMGCRMGQGYLYSRAVPADIVTGLLQRFGENAHAQMPILDLATANAA